MIILEVRNGRCLRDQEQKRDMGLNALVAHQKDLQHRPEKDLRAKANRESR
jgi:hypothetical protein